MKLSEKAKNNKKQKNYVLLYMLIIMVALVYFSTLIKLSN